MIDYLAQLERDLAEAIDRRERVPAARRLPHLRPDLVAAVAAIALALALVMVLGSRDEPTPQPVRQPTTPAITNPKPIPKGARLRISGGLRRTGPATWSGPARGPGGGGTLMLTGETDLSPRPCCDTPRSIGRKDAHVLQFRWRTPQGVLGGCVVNTVLRRPYGRFVWDGPGLVTIATGGFARFRGRAIALAGATNLALTTRARIILGGDARPPGGC
jgi:hypothetical protein